jgi:hypothetical protein
MGGSSMNMKGKKEVIKHSAAIQIQNNITLLQRRAWNVLLANAYDELPTAEEHCIDVQDLMQALEFYSKNDKYLKEALRALVTCSVEWNLLNKDGKTQWGISALLASAVIDGGLCTYAYSPELRRRLHNPAMYARLCLSMQNKFESKHAQALWELCVDYLGAERDYGETPFIPIADYRRLMGIAKEEYPNFSELNRRVVKEPVAEINRVSDFRVTVDYQTQGRKVTALKFRIRRVALLPEAVTRQGNLFPDLEDMPVVVMALKDAGMSSQDAWDIWQHGFGFVDEAARPPADPHEDVDAAFVRYVREKIHLLRRRQVVGRVENSTGFLLEAIRRNYANPEFEHDLKRQAAAEALKTSKERAQQVKTLEAQKAEIEKARDKDLDAIYGKIAQESLDVLEAALPEIRAENFIFRQFYEPDKSALENYQASPMLRMGFIPYLERHAPERVQAVRQRYAAEIAAVEERIAALS